MFNLGSFIKSGFISAVGKMADYQIILNAAGWFEKGVLNETDLAEIQAAIDEKNAPAKVEEQKSIVTDESEQIDSTEVTNSDSITE